MIVLLDMKRVLAGDVQPTQTTVRTIYPQTILKTQWVKEVSWKLLGFFACAGFLL